VAIGDPGPGYPLPWLVQTWLPGVTAFEDDPGESEASAHDLAVFIGGSGVAAAQQHRQIRYGWRGKHPAARSRRTARSAALRVSDAARVYSARDSS